MSQSKSVNNISSWQNHISALSNTAVSVDCVIFGYHQDGLKVLTLDCDMEPFLGKTSLVGELVKADECLDQAALRILKYWTGIGDLYMEQVKTFGAPDRHPLGRVISIAYYALVPIKKFNALEGRNNLHWEDISDLNDMAFDHTEILKSCLKTLRRKIRDKPLGFSLLPKKFTLIQIQSLYESILGVELDKRNFRRKLQNQNILIDLDEREKDVSHRPAKMYSFDFEKYQSEKKARKFDFAN